jgi:hypothetical protein
MILINAEPTTKKLEIEIDDFVAILGKTRKKYLPLLKSDGRKKFKRLLP